MAATGTDVASRRGQEVVADHILPADIRRALNPEQIERLRQLVEDRRTLHAVDYRASTSFLGRAFYLSFFMGAEGRSLRRLRREGQRRSLHRLVAEVVSICLLVSLVTCLVVGAAVIVLYLSKSWLGIDLMEGHSFLHDYFYWR